MKNGNNKAFEQVYNAEAAVAHENRLIVGHSLSDHPNDKQEAAPTAQSIPPQLGTPQAAASDNGYFGADAIAGLEAMGIDAYIALGRNKHHVDLATLRAGEPEQPPDNADHKLNIAYKLLTETGQAIYKLRKSTVEPVFGIIKEVDGPFVFR